MDQCGQPCYPARALSVHPSVLGDYNTLTLDITHKLHSPAVSSPPRMLSLPLPLYTAFIDCLVGLVVKASASTAEHPGFQSSLRRDFLGSSPTSDLNIGTPVATLPGAWRCRVSTGTGRPAVSMRTLGEVESWTCNFDLSVVAREIVRASPSLRYASMLLGR